MQADATETEEEPEEAAAAESAEATTIVQYLTPDEIEALRQKEPMQIDNASPDLEEVASAEEIASCEPAGDEKPAESDNIEMAIAPLVGALALPAEEFPMSVEVEAALAKAKTVPPANCAVVDVSDSEEIDAPPPVKTKVVMKKPAMAMKKPAKEPANAKEQEPKPAKEKKPAKENKPAKEKKPKPAKEDKPTKQKKTAKEKTPKPAKEDKPAKTKIWKRPPIKIVRALTDEVLRAYKNPDGIQFGCTKCRDGPTGCTMCNGDKIHRRGSQ